MKQNLAWLRRLLHEHIGDTIIALSVIFVLLATVRAYQEWSSVAELVHIKTTAELASVILGIVLGGVGAIAGYRRFFKGRTFTERARIELSSHPVCKLPRKGSDLQRDGKSLDILHVVDVAIENIGSTTIWQPSLNIKARHLDSDEDFPAYGRVDEIETRLAPLSIDGIEPGETTHYHHRFSIPKRVVAFRVSVELSTSRNNVWHRSMTLKNGLSGEPETGSGAPGNDDLPTTWTCSG